LFNQKGRGEAAIGLSSEGCHKKVDFTSRWVGFGRGGGAGTTDSSRRRRRRDKDRSRLFGLLNSTYRHSNKKKSYGGREWRGEEREFCANHLFKIIEFGRSSAG